MNDKIKKNKEVDNGKDFRLELEQCQKEKEEYLNSWKRAKADLINYQKDEAKRLEEMAKFSNWSLMEDLISVIDNFELAIEVLEKSGQAEKGIYMIKTKLEDSLKKRGLEKMAVSVGQPFDPSLHEVMGQMEAEVESGAIAEEIEGGYILNGRVIRPARVRVAK
ncbi:MAG: nucleotide exchange factor GrpE [bacterium]|nr:nucleotide exchange factor GrpE [bacterium]